MLTLRIPKAEEVKPRQIRISPTVEGQSSNRTDAHQQNGQGAGHSTSETTPVGVAAGDSGTAGA